MENISIDYLKLECAKNGLILEWDEYREPANGENCYDGRMYKGRQQKVFKLSESKQAISEFIAMGVRSGKITDTEDLVK